MRGMRTYLYGDSTLSPLQHDFIALLPEAIDFIVRALSCDARMNDALEHAAGLTQRTEREIEEVQTMIVEAAGPLDRRTATEGDSLAGRCAAQIRQRMNELVRAETERARDTVAAETVRAEKTAAGERSAFVKAFESLVLRSSLPDTVDVIEVSAENAVRYIASRRASTSYGLRWTSKIDIPQSHPLGRVMRLERLIERVEVEAPEPGGWLHKELKVRTQRLDRLYLMELTVTPDDTKIKLRASAEATGGGYDLTFGKDATQVQIVRVPESGLPDAPYEAAPNDSSTLQDLHARLRSLATDLIEHETVVVTASLDERPLSQLAPRGLVERLIASLAPSVQQIAKRSLVPGELVLKRQVGDNQREELFVSKAVLWKKIETLSPELQRVLDPLDLGAPALSTTPTAPAAPTAEPFTLLRDPGESPPISVPVVSVPAVSGTVDAPADSVSMGPRSSTQPRVAAKPSASETNGAAKPDVDTDLQSAPLGTARIRAS
jgi:hypothetical protein